MNMDRGYRYGVMRYGNGNGYGNGTLTVESSMVDGIRSHGSFFMWCFECTAFVDGRPMNYKGEVSSDIFLSLSVFNQPTNQPTNQTDPRVESQESRQIDWLIIPFMQKVIIGFRSFGLPNLPWISTHRVASAIPETLRSSFTKTHVLLLLLLLLLWTSLSVPRHETVLHQRQRHAPHAISIL